MNRKGMSLIEILVAVAIGVIVFTSIVAAFYYLFIMNETTRAGVQVYQDVAAAMERITNTPLTSLNTRYPDGQHLSAAEISLITGGNGFRVNGETITVSYPRGTGDSVNPREIVVTATWSVRGRQQKSMSLQTFKGGSLT